MSLLYPRLLSGQAKPLYHEYLGLSISELVQRVDTNHDSAVYVAIGGDRVSDEKLKELRKLVVDLAAEAGFPEKPDPHSQTTFDQRLAILLHSESGLTPAEAASGDIWAFLALILMPDISFWRYPNPPRDRVLATDITRHIFGRLWWRAQLVHSAGDRDPYSALQILGEAAFDQIYARRAALGGSPYLVKAILRVWNGLDLRGLNSRRVLIDFLMRLLRLAPFLQFETLDEPTLDAELRMAVRESVTALLANSDLDRSEIQYKINSIFKDASTERITPWLNP
ncbi:DUF6339 family protein [Saccharopolyspora shandongensis]|uniref:DUF6339 family protein n=1 Tax=Saccharopolyspora shandongensis TaxID=418495 RepID=UPI0034084A75